MLIAYKRVTRTFISVHLNKFHGLKTRSEGELEGRKKGPVSSCLDG